MPPRTLTLAVLASLSSAVAGCIGESPTSPGQTPECEAPFFDASTWQEVRNSVYSFSIPGSYQRPAGSTRWESGRRWVQPQIVARGEVPLDPPATLQDYSECRAVIGGIEALIQLGSTASSTRFGLGWYLSATWEDVTIDADGNEGFLLIEAWSPLAEDIVALESIFFTVSFQL